MLDWLYRQQPGKKFNILGCFDGDTLCGYAVTYERRANLAGAVDKPIAGLIRDLKSRGMLDDTVVVWTTEFGRTPTVPDPSRGHRSR